ncbi:MAG: MBL fold metallo-hydrolase [Verrucomicrobia bacterium]|nr:MBL fold metallo-hydrolase [Verrucomicrobiota bacterium]
MRYLFLSLLFAQSLLAQPSSIVVDSNQNVLKELPFGNHQDFEDAARGFIAPLPDEGVIKDLQGNIVWDLKRYDIIRKEENPPPMVNPSLWRQAKLLCKAGLFSVTERIYQVRGADLSNMTLIEGRRGVIVVDPLVSVETARTALDLYRKERGDRPVTAVIYTHSHIDHFGGIRGVLNEDQIGKVKIYAPRGFSEATLSEGVLAGNAMARRASYMYGILLNVGPEGQMTSGLGLTSSTGQISLLLPTNTITQTGQKIVIDGVLFEFLYAPDSEAPAEMLFYLPQFKALCAAEDATHTMHNLYSLRGTKIRDALAWSHYLNETIALFGAESEVVFAQHHWPTWGNERVIDFLEKQRDLYKYIHDQTLHLANQGFGMLDIAEMIKLPKSLSDEWYNRGYYGSVSHNAKSVYCNYLGWFDGNPSNLNPLPTAAAGAKMVEYMGGADSVIEKSREDFEKGNYRWVAQVLNYLVFSDPSNKEAKDLLANTLEQMGYQTENATWRNFYLTGAQELRHGVPKTPFPLKISPDFIAAMPTPALFDYLAILLSGPQAAENPLAILFIIPDRKEKYLLQIKNGVLNYHTRFKPDAAQVTLHVNRSDLNDIVLGIHKLKDLIAEKKAQIEGNPEILTRFLSMLHPFEFWFPIVEPQ